RQVCTFYLDGLFLGVDVQQVQEVIRYHEMTRVPRAPHVVEGLINLRGQIVTAIDLRRRLELTDRSNGQLPMNVVVRTSDGVVSLLVDEIGDVLEVDEDAFERPPETLQGVARELIQGTYKLKDQLLLLLDTEKAVSVSAETIRTPLTGWPTRQRLRVSQRGPAESKLTAESDGDSTDASAGSASDASLFVRLGGDAAISTVVERFYEHVLDDNELRPFFNLERMGWLKKRQKQFFTQALGGPAAYRGASMKSAHRKLEIGQHHFDRVATHLVSALEGCGVSKPLVNEVVALVAPLAKDIVNSPAVVC
ncbi:MAG TPA: chemotaxis protein CheW, partial [Pirellulales bacterium]|nr:chemotaxis protein CheW [Pirellulales bacterium]